MMQKEVAQRVVAPAGNSERGSLSVFLQYQFEISVVMQVPAQSFFPPPKVDSTILEFVPRESEVSAEVEKAFFRLIRFGFTQPRKTLANNLVAGYHVDRSVAVDWMGAVGVEERARAQELSVQQWLDMARALSEL
jgi:16S rRNA (adenine1518-N6/adenine1519-N6)-dimethyltransferase